jgi:hypothetical protein
LHGYSGATCPRASRWPCAWPKSHDGQRQVDQGKRKGTIVRSACRNLTRNHGQSYAWPRSGAQKPHAPKIRSHPVALRLPCVFAQVKMFLRTVSVAVRAPGRETARGHGHMADSVCVTARVLWHFPSSDAMWDGTEERSVKPSAQPTLVRTQHLPPTQTPAQGRLGVPDSSAGHAARCHRRPPDAAFRGIYAGPIPPEPPGPGPHRAGDRQLVGYQHQASRSAASMRMLAVLSLSSRHLA